MHLTMLSHFGPSYAAENNHLLVYSGDVLFDPPGSYLSVQGALIVGCGVMYAMCYASYIKKYVGLPSREAAC